MAFAVENLALDTVSDEKRDEMIDGLAHKVVAKGLEVPAVFVLESHKPLSFVASQALLLGAPVLGAFFGFREVNQWAHLLEDRQNLSRLVEKIDLLSKEKEQAKKAGRKK